MLKKLEKKKLFILDVDGVVFRGRELIEGAPEAIEKLADMGKRVVFLSNNSTKSTKRYLKKFRDAGIDVKKEDLMLATTATALYISRKSPGARVFTTGEAGLREELRLHKLRVVNEPESCEYLVAASNRRINFDILTRAMRCCLRSDVKYLAVNPDRIVPSSDGPVPGTGMIIGALYWLTGRKPVIIGKPSPIIVKEALRKWGFRGEDAVIIGDQPGIDIKVANRLGITSVLVLSGAVGKDWREVCRRERVKPDAVVKSLADVV